MKSASIRPAIFLLLALALSAPTLVNVVDGSDSATNAGVHLGAAILVACLSVLMVGHLVDSYQAGARRRHHQAQRNEPR